MLATFSHIFQHLATLYCVTLYCPEYLLLSSWVQHFDFYFEYPVASFMFSKFGRYPKELICCNTLFALLFCFAFFRPLHLFCFGFVLLIFKKFLFPGKFLNFTPMMTFDITKIIFTQTVLGPWRGL